MTAIREVTTWIDLANQKPGTRNTAFYISMILEETSEALESLNYSPMKRFIEEIKSASRSFRNGGYDHLVERADKVALMDAACDLVWVSAGLGHMIGDIEAAFNEVIASNYSKGENGMLELDTTGKVIKGSSYFEPVLSQYIYQTEVENESN